MPERNKPKEQTAPGYIPTPYQVMAYNTFGASARHSGKNDVEFNRTLEMAAIQIKAEVYISMIWLTTIMVWIVTSMIGLGLMLWGLVSGGFVTDLLAQGEIVGAVFYIILYIFLFALIPLMTYGIMFKIPSFKAKRRRRDIESNLPYATNFVAAMAAANATPTKIFRSLGAQEDIYGEIAKDGMQIYKDISLLGMDVITALKHAIKMAPSPKYRDFLQGITSTLQSGGNLKSYFMNKAEEYMREHESEQKEFLETLSFMAESYVVVAVAMPIFLMVILIIMYWISGSGMDIGETLLYLIVFVMLPVIHLGYIATVNMLTPEV